MSRRRSACRSSPAIVLALVLAGATGGCGGEERMARVPDRRPTESETRDAYFGTPMIFDDQARAVPPGTSAAALFERLGRASIRYESSDASASECVVYPIYGTQRWDERGSPEADEWEFCFDGRDRLLTKRRISLDRDR